MSIAESVKGDIVTAMKAGERDRLGTLRMLLSELQKAAKEGTDDELAVLRRERKRRSEAERAFRDGGREDLANAEAAEAEIITAYLPAELDDATLSAIVARAVEQSGAASVKDLGRGDADRDGGGRRPRRRPARLRAGARGARGRVRRQFELANDLAAALAAGSDAMLLAFEQRLGCGPTSAATC